MEPSEISGPSNRLRIGIILGVVVIVLGVSAYVLLQQETPTGLVIKLNSGTVTEANSVDIGLRVVLSLHNTSSKPITYYGASYLISQNGNTLTGDDWFDKIVVSPGGTQLVNETITVNLGDVVVTTPITGAGTWELRGTANVEVAGANTTQGFDFNFATQ